MHRVVITGIGIYSCLGKNIEAVTRSLYEGRSGIGLDPARKAMGYRSCLTGLIEQPVLKGRLERRARVGLSEEAEYAYVATLEAIEKAGLDPGYFDDHIAGIIYGNDSSARAVVEAVDLIRLKKDTTLIGSGSIFQSMNSTVTMNLATIFRLKGINYTLSAACASGSHSLGMAYYLIRSGLQDMILCGGAQEVNPFAFGSFDGLSAFSVRENEPARASRPFDRERDGLVPSGGAATLILESYAAARSRGAPLLGEVVGYGFSSNGDHIAGSSVNGQQRAMEMALAHAEMKAGEISYINAHATSTPAGDTAEAKAIHAVFGPAQPRISSTKSMTGHECWMAGASEIVYSLLMMKHGFIAPNINFENPDEDSARLNIVTSTQESNVDTVLSNSFGFGGTNSALIVKKINE
jgi:3-oxoacyl-[acyl-carrier-protein] synthase-1